MQGWSSSAGGAALALGEETLAAAAQAARRAERAGSARLFGRAGVARAR
jgi:hypothetical protein